MLGSTLVYPDENEAHFLPNLLDAADVSISYRRRYMALIEAAPAVDLILLDETNPRSVVFQLSVIQGHVDLLPDDGLRTYGRSEKRLAFEALTRLRLCDGNNLCEQVKHDDDKRGKCFHRPKLDEILSATVEAMTQLSYLITTNYFAHAEPSRALAQIPMGNT